MRRIDKGGYPSNPAREGSTEPRECQNRPKHVGIKWVDPVLAQTGPRESFSVCHPSPRLLLGPLGPLGPNWQPAWGPWGPLEAEGRLMGAPPWALWGPKGPKRARGAPPEARGHPQSHGEPPRSPPDISGKSHFLTPGHSRHQARFISHLSPTGRLL